MWILWMLMVLVALGLVGLVFHKFGWLTLGNAPFYDDGEPKPGKSVWVKLFSRVLLFGVWRA